MTTFFLLFFFSVSLGFCIFIHIWRKSVEKGTCLHYNFRFSQSNCPSKFPAPRVMFLRFPCHPVRCHPVSPGLRVLAVLALFISLPAIWPSCHWQAERPGQVSPVCPSPFEFSPMLKLYTYLQVMFSWSESFLQRLQLAWQPFVCSFTANGHFVYVAWPVCACVCVWVRLWLPEI